MMMYIWIALIICFSVMEAMTAQLVSIWFVVGSAASLAGYFFGANEVLQLVIFVIVSLIALAATRPIVKKYLKTKIQPTNADSAIGLEAVVTERIDNIRSQGAVKLKGLEWTARSLNGDEIDKDEIVTVKAIEGVKLIVEKKQ